MKKLERYIVATYSNSCQTAIMNNMPVTFPDPVMPTIIMGTDTKLPKNDVEMNHLERNNIDESTYQSWGRKIYIKTTCTIYTILSWARPTNNCRRRCNRMPPFRWLNQAKTLSDTWWYSRMSSSRINPNNIPSGLYAYWPGYYTTPSSMQTKIWLITWSYFVMHRSSTRYAIESLYQKDYKTVGWIYFNHYMPLILTNCQTMEIRRWKQE